MIRRIFGEGEKRMLSGYPLIVKNILSLAASSYLFFSVFIYPDQLLHRTLCFGLFFSIIFLSYSTPGANNIEKIPWYDYILSIVSVSVSIYMALNLERLIDRMLFVSEVYVSDHLFALITVILLLEGTRRIIGHWISTLSLFSLLYIFAGQYIPGRFGHHGFSLDFITDSLFLSTNGIWGSPLGIATSNVIIFIIFGSFFMYSGAGDFIFSLASSFVKGSRGGVAKIAVVTSALFGMISGNPVSNVSTMGSLTIPSMKKQGYSSEFAASVESCSSVGGIIMPPIMGSVAFIMSDVVGIPYVKVAYSAFFPALMFFFAIFVTIDIRSQKLKIHQDPSAEYIKINMKLIRTGFVFFIPLMFLISRLMMGISPSKVGVESIMLLILINIRKINFKNVASALIDRIEKGLMIVATMATSGIMLGIMNTTGVSSKFSSVLISMSGESILITLVLVMLLAMFLGLAMNITSAYLLTAVMTAPIMIRLGVEPLAAHMFILFFSAMATITPPVAITAFTAAAIADAPPMAVGFQSMRMALVAYILPFIFVFNPSILLIGTVNHILLTLAFSVFSVFTLTLSIEGGNPDNGLSIIKRILLFFFSIMILSDSWIFVIAGLIAILVLLMASHIKYIFKEEINETQ